MREEPLPPIAAVVSGVVVSRWVQPGRVNATAYNHYGLLRSIEDLFALGHLGYANRPTVSSFGHDVFDAT